MPGKRPFPRHGLAGQQQCVHPVHHVGAAGSKRQPAGTVVWAETLLLCCRGLGRGELWASLLDQGHLMTSGRLMTSLLGGSAAVLLGLDLMVKSGGSSAVRYPLIAVFFITAGVCIVSVLQPGFGCTGRPQCHGLAGWPRPCMLAVWCWGWNGPCCALGCDLARGQERRQHLAASPLHPPLSLPQISSGNVV